MAQARGVYNCSSHIHDVAEMTNFFCEVDIEKRLTAPPVSIALSSASAQLYHMIALFFFFFCLTGVTVSLT